MTLAVNDVTAHVTSYRSADPDRIEDFWARHVRAAVAFDRSVAPPSPFVFASASLGPVSVGKHQPHMDLRVRDEEEDFYLFAVARHGYTAYRDRGGMHVTRPGYGLFYRPGNGPPQVRSGGGSRLAWLRIESWALERHLETLLGRPVVGPLALTSLVDLRHGAASAWLPLFEFLVDQVSAPRSVLGEPLVAGPLYEAVLTGMLFATEHQYHEALSRPATPRSPRSIKRAVDAIHAHPEQPHTAATLARLADTSVRTLQDGFRRYLGAPPMAYLREVRLACAHNDLMHDDVVSVAEVATRWGFTHLGRFAAAYAARYGTVPSRTTRLH